MSADTKLLKEKFKNAPEVTSLASSDRLAVIGDDGTPKKINSSVINGFNPSRLKVEPNQWLRIASFISTTSPIGILFLSHEWNNAPARNTVLVLGCVGDATRKPISVNVLLSDPDPSFNAIRCVADGNVRYIEIRYTKPVTNAPLIRFDGIGLATIPFSISTVADADVINTVSLISAPGGGGGNDYRSINYAIISEGGGLRDGRYEEDYQRPAEGKDDGCGSGQRILWRHKLHYSGWSLSRRFFHEKQACGLLWLSATPLCRKIDLCDTTLCRNLLINQNHRHNGTNQVVKRVEPLGADCRQFNHLATERRAAA